MLKSTDSGVFTQFMYSKQYIASIDWMIVSSHDSEYLSFVFCSLDVHPLWREMAMLTCNQTGALSIIFTLAVAIFLAVACAIDSWEIVTYDK